MKLPRTQHNVGVMHVTHGIKRKQETLPLYANKKHGAQPNQTLRPLCTQRCRFALLDVMSIKETGKLAQTVKAQRPARPQQHSTGTRGARSIASKHAFVAS